MTPPLGIDDARKLNACKRLHAAWHHRGSKRGLHMTRPLEEAR